MIKLAEVMLKSAEHENFNAGMIYQICKAYDNSKIIFFGHSEYIAHMKNVLAEAKVDYEVEFVPIDFLMETSDLTRCLTYIYSFGDALSNIIFLTVDTNTLVSINAFLSEHSGLEAYVCGHGDIECLTKRKERVCQASYIFSFRPRTIAHVIKDILIQVMSYPKRKMNRKYAVKAWLDFCSLDNAHVFLFSSAYRTADLEKKIKKAFSKVVFIHLPYILKNNSHISKNVLKPDNNEPIRIGCTPRALRERGGYTWKIIKYVIRHADRVNNKFVFSFFVHYHPNWKHVETYGAGEESNSINFWKTANDRAHYITFIEGIDYMLIGYGREMYQLSSSGIMTDAVYNGIPTFMYQSHCFDDFDSWNIGRRAYTVKEMGESIIDEINCYTNDRAKCYEEELRKCQETFEQDNILTLRHLKLERLRNIKNTS